MNTPQVLLRVPTNPSDPWSRSLAVQLGHRGWHVASPPGHGRHPPPARTRPEAAKNCHPGHDHHGQPEQACIASLPTDDIFCGWRVGSLDEGAERSASGAESEG
jgi:hypothetical protein